MKKSPIFMFHAVDHHNDVLGVSSSVFETLMQNLNTHNYQAQTLSNLYEAMKLSDNPANTCALTFDDGYASVYENALPLMEKYQHKATLFLTVGTNGNLMQMSGRQMLNWEQIRELHRMGYEIGAHTLTHPDLRQLSDTQRVKEIIEPKQIIEDKLGDRVTTFAYPFGYYDKQSADLVAEHYDYAVATQLRYAKATDVPHLLPRIETYYLRQKPFQSLMGTATLPLYMAIRALPRWLRSKLT
jgi:peptidoglycan/xylan/chitin deacetylase (PgdA/CDA1 family)